MKIKYKIFLTSFIPLFALSVTLTIFFIKSQKKAGLDKLNNKIEYNINLFKNGSWGIVMFEV